MKQQNSDLVKIVMCTLVPRNCVPFCMHLKRLVYPGDRGTHYKLHQIPKFNLHRCSASCGNGRRMVTWQCVDITTPVNQVVDNGLCNAGDR